MKYLISEKFTNFFGAMVTIIIAGYLIAGAIVGYSSSFGHDHIFGLACASMAVIVLMRLAYVFYKKRTNKSITFA